MKLIFYSSFLFLFFFLAYEKPTHFSVPESSLEGDPLPCVNKQFPIALQIVRDSLGNQATSVGTVLNEINDLNELFDPICVSFRIDTVRIIENQSYDRIDKPFEFDSLRIKYHIPYRINLYVGTTMGVSDYERGVATFEGITQASVLSPAIGVDKDIFSINDNFLAHYIGVYFGLLPTSHTDNGQELVDGSNCDVAGDGFCDTPADPFQAYPNGIPDDGTVGQYYQEGGCRFIYPEKDANNEFYNPDISNIMSYYTPCRCTFSDEQYIYFAQTYLNNPGNIW